MEMMLVMTKINLLKPKWSGYFTYLPFAELMKLPTWWFNSTLKLKQIQAPPKPASMDDLDWKYLNNMVNGNGQD
jgi:hypothetical protein